uniref:Uncharacterized protein n=1 Tax=Theropithecus gelada TaxID=9565 RepID=A0A8D2FJT2_THEGE
MSVAPLCNVVMAATKPGLLHEEEAKRACQDSDGEEQKGRIASIKGGQLCQFTKATDMCPKNASYYSNRAAILMMLGMKLADGFFRGHLREGKCHLSPGNAMAAHCSFQKALELDHNNAHSQQEFTNANAVVE